MGIVDRNIRMSICRNFCIGYYPENSKSLSTYMFMNRELQFGDEEVQQKCLDYIKQKEPTKDWQIFYLVPIANISEEFKTEWQIWL